MPRITRRTLLAQTAAIAWLATAQARPFFARGGSPRGSVPPPNPDNTMTLSNQSGGSLTNYPLQFGRPFLEGEIADYPQVLVAGSAVPTQANVKNRHTDGSVKYAVISCLIPSMPNSSPIELTFQNQASGNTTALTQAEMLAAGYDFDGQIELKFPASIQGSPNATIATWNAITDGALAFTYDSTHYEVTGMDFSSVTILADTPTSVNTVINTAFAAAIAALTIPAMRIVVGRNPTYTVNVSRFTGPNADVGTGHTLALATPSTGTDISGLVFAASTVSAASSTQTTSARTMLNAGHYTEWAPGQIAQMIELADDSATRTYDIGGIGDGYHPFRPRFYATFWATINKVCIRYCGEAGLSDEIGDLYYYLTLKSGNASPSTVYTIELLNGSNAKLHFALSMWTKTFWIGGQPNEQVNIDPNIAYLAATRYIYNYDPSVVISEAHMASEYSIHQSKNNDLYDGNWNTQSILMDGMSTAGGRLDLSCYPQWSVLWLYTGDWRMRKRALKLADIACAWPMYIRENVTGKKLARADAAGSSTGLGKPLSLAGRPTCWTNGKGAMVGADSLAADRLFLLPQVGLYTWKWDVAHQPSYFYPQYIMTGDPFYLYLMIFWHSMTHAKMNINRRGPNKYEGHIDDELRGNARAILNRVETWNAMPDDYGQRADLETLVNECLADWEGELNITTGVYNGNTMWTFGRALGAWYCTGPDGDPYGNIGVPPTLGNWERQNKDRTAQTIDENAGIYNVNMVGGYTTVWMQNLVCSAVARCIDLGFAGDALLIHSFNYNKTALAHSDQAAKLSVGASHIAVSDYNSPYADLDWDGIIACFTTGWLGGFDADYWPDNAQGVDRQQVFAPAAAKLKEIGATGADAFYSWYVTNVHGAANYPVEPSYAVIPRVT